MHAHAHAHARTPTPTHLTQKIVFWFAMQTWVSGAPLPRVFLIHTTPGACAVLCVFVGRLGVRVSLKSPPCQVSVIQSRFCFLTFGSPGGCHLFGKVDGMGLLRILERESRFVWPAWNLLFHVVSLKATWEFGFFGGPDVRGMDGTASRKSRDRRRGVGWGIRFAGGLVFCRLRVVRLEAHVPRQTAHSRNGLKLMYNVPRYKINVVIVQLDSGVSDAFPS